MPCVTQQPVVVFGFFGVFFKQLFSFMPQHVNSLRLMVINKANLRDLIAATGLVISNWIQIVNFSARVTVKFDG